MNDCEKHKQDCIALCKGCVQDRIAAAVQRERERCLRIVRAERMACLDAIGVEVMESATRARAPFANIIAAIESGKEPMEK